MPALIANLLLTRTQLLQKLIDPRRNIDKECGYPEGEPDARFYRLMYDRNDVATRVVDLWPDECWSVYPSLFENEDESVTTPFEKAWEELSLRINPWYYLHRVDELSGIGRFGVLLMGFDDGKVLSSPLEGIDPITGEAAPDAPERKLLFLRPFDECVVSVASYEDNPSSARYGLPKMYDIQLPDLSVASSIETSDQMRLMPTQVHWSRVIHVADNRKNSEVYGTPRQKPVINRLCDLRKILGGSGEMFWRGAFSGFAFETLPELIAQGLVELDEESLRDQYEDYSNGLKRFLALNGMKATSLAPQVADPTAHVEQHIHMIAIALKVPIRVFTGTEAAHLASTQDAGTWNRRLARRQSMYLTPLLIRPFIDRLIAVKALPKPAENYRIQWVDLNAMSDKDKADVALKKAQAMLQYVTGGIETTMTLLDFLVHFIGLDQKTAQQVVANSEKNKNKRVTEEVWQQPAGGMGAAAPGQSPNGKGIERTAKANKKPARNSLG